MLKRISANIAQYIKSADLLLLGLAIVISLLGLVMVYSTTYEFSSNRLVVVQASALGVGVVGFILISLLELRRFPRLWVLLLFFNILFQLSLKWVGEAGDSGNNSWIPFGPLNIQPGEVGKIIFIFTLASHIQALKDKLNSPLSVLQLVAHMGIITVAVYAVSRDLGIALLYPVIFIVMVFAAGISLWWMGAFALGTAAVIPIVWSIMGEYQRLRIMVVFEPEISPKYAWHAKLSMNALSSGGLTGKGFMQGTYFYARQNDFIFSAVGEEFGFIGCIVLLGFLSLLIFRIFRDSLKTDDLFGHVLCIGIGGMFLMQTLIHVGMNAGIVPVIGLTLPFISAGGSSLMTSIAALGLVSGVTMRRKPNRLR